MAKDKTAQHETFFSLLNNVGIKLPTPEYMFNPVRKWRLDYAWPEQRIALEVEGGIFIHGRHSRGAGMEKDFEKYNTAALQGWRIVKCVPKKLCSFETIELLKQLIE